jgi:hypothetical protein
MERFRKGNLSSPCKEVSATPIDGFGAAIPLVVSTGTKHSMYPQALVSAASSF